MEPKKNNTDGFFAHLPKRVLFRRKTMKLLIAATCLSLPMVTNAQTENPRGIYKMTTLIGKVGEIKAPFDQYKICTDSITMMLTIQNKMFSISHNDSKVFNYTGDQPKDENDKSTLIYNSNADHFHMKWWSQYKDHLYFPNNDWCTEVYESNKYSETGQMAFDALNAPATLDKDNLLYGTWRILGDVDELRDVKKRLPKLHEEFESSKYYNSFYIFAPKSFAIVLLGRGGIANPIEYNGKKSYKLEGKTINVKWLNKNRIAVEERIDYRIDWKILERIDDGQIMLNRFASKFLRE